MNLRPAIIHAHNYIKHCAFAHTTKCNMMPSKQLPTDVT